MKKIYFFLICIAFVIAFLAVANDPMEYSANDPDRGSMLLVGAAVAILFSVWAATTSKPLLRVALWILCSMGLVIFGIGATMVCIVMMVTLWRFVESNPEIKDSLRKVVEAE